MLTATTAVHTYFAKLGFEPEIADIYLALYAHGPQTISELSRTSKVERTRIYRLLDTLMESNLIEVESHYKRGIIKAAPISNLHILISEKQQEIKSLEQELGLMEQVLSKNSLSSPATRVQFYRGPEGIRQMQWNQLKAKTELLSFIDEPLGDTLGKAFTVRWTEAVNQAGLRLRMIKSPHFEEVNERWYKQHKITEELIPSHESRRVGPEEFEITSNMDIWDDVVAYYNWKDGDVFGVELYNKDIASMQRQLFEMVWSKARPSKSRI